MRLYKSNVKSILLYGSESWQVVKTDLRRVEVFHNGCLRRSRNVFWPNKISNHQLYNKTGSRSITKESTQTSEMDRIPGVALRWTPWKEKTWKAQNHLAPDGDRRTWTERGGESPMKRVFIVVSDDESWETLYTTVNVHKNELGVGSRAQRSDFSKGLEFACIQACGWSPMNNSGIRCWAGTRTPAFRFGESAAAQACGCCGAHLAVRVADRGASSPCRKAVVGGMAAGALGQFMASPTDLVKVQMQMEGRRRLEGKPPRLVLQSLITITP
ncbi:hypothetical protein SKAU_G00185750 [Synaphobranchus kaupii]|uniref:Uncharacterized protein n=1 Tax=Synaphobranchus kaupii TaxID=118154 RepID=A0A9Q1IWE1_SYNKA|nr:hypothetical protein SKAU_G00185750 [Synaphobranchus kaupii]